jgi:hypothetical protein
MQLSKALVVSCGVLLGATAVVAEQGTLPSHRTLLTFRGPVALPGVSLAAGTYAFELADPNASPDIVMVLNRDRTHVFYMGMTQRITRPVGVSSDRRVIFGEPAGAAATPIDTWYPSGGSDGHQFLYKTR